MIAGRALEIGPRALDLIQVYLIFFTALFTNDDHTFAPGKVALGSVPSAKHLCRVLR